MVHVRDEALNGEALPHHRPGGLAYAAGGFWILEKTLDSGCQPVRSLRRHQEARLTFGDEVRQTTNACGNHRTAGCHRFDS